MRLNRLSLPRGWFTPVTPGTHWVTLGGMVAADVHGKNHHVAGTFGEHVRSLRMRLADGRLIECSDEQERELFRATLGGMGLTGHVLEVTFQMTQVATPWIWQESEQVPNFETALERLAEAGREWPYTVCWNDLLSDGPRLGRGLLMKSRWAEPGEAPGPTPRWRGAPTFPFLLPSWRCSRDAALGNSSNFAKHGPRPQRHRASRPASIRSTSCAEWNRVYGKRGFTQYQAVLPVRTTIRVTGA